MKLIVGLGNPGPKYIKTRHNFGFLAVDFLRTHLAGLSEWENDNIANALVAKSGADGEQIILAKPQIFMNLSGQAVQKLANFYKIEPKDIWVIHDDFDLPLGVIRISQNASAAGHKGVKSIVEALSTKDFTRVRLGMHPVGQTFLNKIFNKVSSIEKFVLKNFDKSELKTVQETIQKAALAIETALKEGIRQAMNEFN